MNDIILKAQKEMAEKDEKIKKLESLYCASVEKNTFQLRVYEKQLQDAKCLIRELQLLCKDHPDWDDMSCPIADIFSLYGDKIKSLLGE